MSDSKDQDNQTQPSEQDLELSHVEHAVQSYTEQVVHAYTQWIYENGCVVLVDESGTQFIADPDTLAQEWLADLEVQAKNT